MEPRDDAGTLTPDPPSAGDFVWGTGKGQLRWPGRVRADADVPPKAAKERPLDGHCVYVAFFGDGGAGWCDAGKLTSFPDGFPELVAQSTSKGFDRAVGAAVEAFGRCLEAEMTCGCVPEEVAARMPKGGCASFAGAVVASGIPGEILENVWEFACDAWVGDALKVTVVRSWVAAFARWMGRYAPLAEYNFYRGLPQVKETAEGNSHSEGSVVEVCDGEGKKQRSMAELIAGLDLEMEEGDDVKLCEDGVLVDTLDVPIHRRMKEDSEIKDLNADCVGADEEGSGTGRRERKKSKYLSYPYTLVNMRGQRMFIRPKSSEKKLGIGDSEDTVDATAGDGQAEKTPRSRMAGRLRANVYRDENEFLLNEKTPPVQELLRELLFVALDAMYLVENDFDCSVRGFFGRFRRMVYEGDDEVQRETRLKATPSSASIKTPGSENHGTVQEGKVFPQDGDNSMEGKGKKKKLPSAENGSVGAKSRSYRKKKSIDGIIKGDTQESKSSRRKRVANASQKANGSDGGTSTQKRKRKKKDEANVGKDQTNTDVGVTPLSDVDLEANMGEGNIVKKRNYTKKKKQISIDAGVTHALNTGPESNSSEATKSVKKRSYTKKKEQVGSDLGLTPTVIAGQEADCSGASKSAKKRKYTKKKEQGNTDIALTPTVNAGPEANSLDASRSVENKGTEQADGVTGSASTVPADQYAKNSGVFRSAYTISTDEQWNAVVVSIPTVQVVQEANGSGEFKPVGRRERKKKIARKAGAILAGAVPGEGTPKQKRQRKKKEETNAAEGAVLAVPAFPDINGGGKPKQKRQRKKKEDTNSDKGAALLLSFPKDVDLPSKEELISTYSKFGALSESETVLQKESGSASVVFTNKSDAEIAFNSPDRDKAFGNNLIACQLRYLPGGDSSAPALPLPPPSTPKPPLEFVKKSLESMISTLAASGLSIKDVLGSDIGMNLDSKENLVDEMSELLKKVNSMLTSGPSSTGGGTTTGPAT